MTLQEKTLPERLIAEYNEIVARFEPQIREVDAQVHAELERRKIFHGGKVMKTFLRPTLITRADVLALEVASNILIGAVNTVLNNVFGGDIDRMGAHLGITPEEMELIRLDPGYPMLVAINRMDGFLAGDKLTFLEFNADSPAGIAYLDHVAEIIAQTPMFKEFAKRHSVVSFHSGRETLLDSFRRIYQEWGGKSPMRIAIVDWLDVSTSAEFTMFQEFFEANQIPCTIADPRSAEFDGKKLRFDGFEANFVYRRVIAGELLQRKDDAKPFLEAYRQHAACFANSLRSRLADNKAIFSLFSDPELAHHFSIEERAVFDATIPWTRLVQNEKTTVDGDKVDLIDYIRRNREQLVLKANVSYGGRDVVIGWEATAADWDRAIETALKGSWVAQRKAPIPEEDFPILSESGLTFEPRKVNINPFALGGAYGGCMSRLSTASIINVAAGGGAIPVFVVE